MKRYSHWLWSAIILLICAFAVYAFYENNKQKELNASKLKLEYVHKRAISQFSNAMDIFAAIVSGMRSYMNISEELPSAVEFQSFVQNQLNDIKSQDSIVISFIDTNHVFKYSFTRNAMDPAGLVNKSVSSIRNQKEIDNLNTLMKHDELKLFHPLNLIEGWIGIPLNFRVHRNNKTIGYVAPIINFSTIMQSIYDKDVTSEFVFHFRTDNGDDFDRERIYDKSHIYNQNIDPEYYQNFEVDTLNFMYSTVNYYGMDFQIGSGYKKVHAPNQDLTRRLLLWYLTFVLFVFLIALQINTSKKLNAKLIHANKSLKKRKEEIKTQNNELHKLNDTKNKFFSIIGHDVKQPLNSIKGLLLILKEEEKNNPELQNIIHSLGKSTENTANLLENLLRWARSQTGEIDFNPKVISLNDLVTENVDILNPQALEKFIIIKVQLNEEISITADPDMMSTVIRNLVSNAIKFTNKGGEIIIDATRYEHTIGLTIRDNGIGIPENAIKSLFSLEKNKSTRGTSGEMGTGLGLILCLDFVQKHKGTIKAESKLDEGTVFTVSLPR